MRSSFSLGSLVLFGFYVLLGFVDASFGVAYHQLLEKHNLGVAALAGSLLWGTMAALPLLWFGGAWLGERSKRGALLAVSAGVPVLAWVLLGTSNAWVFLGGVALLLVVTALLDMAASGAALDFEARSGRTLLGRVQSGFAFGAVAGALSSGALFGAGWAWLLGALVTVVGLVLAVGVRALPKASPGRSEDEVTVPARSALLFGVIGGAALVAYYAEGMMQSWSAMFLQRDLGASATTAGVLSGAYYVAFGAGAALSCTLLRAWGARCALRLLSVAAALGAFVLVTAPDVTFAAIGLLGLGVAVSGMVPTLMSWGARSGLGSGAAGFVSTFAYGGMLLEPLAVSLGGESLRPVLLTLPVLLLLVGAATLVRPAARRVSTPLPAPAGD